MKKIALLLIAHCITNLVYPQCTSGTEYLGTAPTSTNDGFIQDIAFGIEEGEFVTISSLIMGDDSEFTSNRTALPNTDYITITQDDISNTVIAHGYSPITINTIGFTIIRMHINLDDNCTTDTDFHDATIQSLTVAPTTCHKPEDLKISYLSDIRIDFFWTAPSVNTPGGYEWEIVPAGNAQGVGVVAFGSTLAPTTTDSSGNVLTANTSYDLYLRSNGSWDGNGFSR